MWLKNEVAEYLKQKFPDSEVGISSAVYYDFEDKEK